MAFDEDTIEVFHDSFRRCQNSPAFVARFYDRFISANPEVAAKFAGVEMRKQRKVLQASLLMVMLACQGNDAAQQYLGSIAARHARTQLDIRPDLYDLWLECLIETVAEMDPRFSDAVEQAWRQVMAHGISYMKSRYDTTAPE